MSHLANKLYINKHRDCLSSPDAKNTSDNIHKDFVVVPIFYASVVTRELRLNNNSSTDT